MSEKRRNYPLPNYVTLVEIPSSEEGEEQQLGLVFDPNFPGFEYHKDEEAAYDAYCDRVDQFLRAEYPQLGPVLDQAPFLADAYALHLLVEVAVMQTFTEIQHESLEQGDWQAAAELGATNLLSVNALVERLDFESFLRTHVAENAAQYHHLFNAFPESYFVAGQLIDKIKIVEEGTEVYLDDAQKADMKKKLKKVLFEDISLRSLIRCLNS